MLEIVKAPADHTVALSFDGKLTAIEFDRIVERIDSALEKHERVNIFCDLTRLTGISPKALLKDFLYGISSLGRMYRFQRMAVVTDNASLETLIKVEDRIFTKIFSDVDIRSFPSLERDAALAWSEANIELPPPGFVLTDVGDGSYIQIEVGAEVTGFDVRRLLQLIRERYAKHGPVNLLTRVDKQPRLGPGVLYEKFKGMDILGLVSKYAVVAPAWAKTRVKALNSVVNTQLHYFPIEEAAQAHAWLTDTTPSVQLIPCEHSHVVAMRLVGKVTDREVKKLYQLLVPQLAEENEVDLLIELPCYEGFSPKGLFQAMKLGLQHFSEVTKGVRRMALITDSRWLSKVVDVENVLLSGVEERPFTFAQKDIAKAWLAEGR